MLGTLTCSRWVEKKFRRLKVSKLMKPNMIFRDESEFFILSLHALYSLISDIFLFDLRVVAKNDLTVFCCHVKSRWLNMCLSVKLNHSYHYWQHGY